MSTKTGTAGQAKHSLTILEQQGLSADNYRALHDGFLADLAKAAKAGTLPDRQTFRRLLSLGPIIFGTFCFAVDYDRGLNALIEEGEYDGKDKNITPEFFPIIGKGLVEFEGGLVHFGCSTEGEPNMKAIEEVDPANPWRAASIEHLLAFGAKFPDEQRKYPIAALGSVAYVHERGRQVPELWEYCGGRQLSLYWFAGRWGGNYRFLAVREVKR